MHHKCSMKICFDLDKKINSIRQKGSDFPYVIKNKPVVYTQVVAEIWVAKLNRLEWDLGLLNKDFYFTIYFNSFLPVLPQAKYQTTGKGTFGAQ